MDRLTEILSEIDLEEQKREIEDDIAEDWYCDDCEHGPMEPKETHCSRCGMKHRYNQDDEITGWEDADIESEVEEIW
jgi:uncharacterized paraquat-inducible protein A